MSSKILWLADITNDDLHDVGSQAVQVGTLLAAYFPFPQGFVIPTTAYFHFLHENNLIAKINKLIATIDYRQPESTQQVSTHIKKLVRTAPLDESLIKIIDSAYHKLSGTLSDNSVTLSPSATKEVVSFIGHPSTITTSGEANILLKIKTMWAAIFEPSLLLMRHEKHIDHFRAGIAIIVQRTIQPETAGIMMTIDPVSNDTSKLLVEAQKPSEYYEIGKRNLSLLNKLTDTKKERLTVNQVIDIAALGKRLEKQTYFPQEVQWALEKKKIVFLKTSPLIIHESVPSNPTPAATQKLQLLLQGLPASKGLAKGLVKKIRSINDLEKVSHGDIVVVHESIPAYKATIKKASAVIIERGGRTSHGAMLAREFGIPAVVEATDALQLLPANTIVTVNGDTGAIYKASHGATHAQTATHLYTILNDPSLADLTSHEDTDGLLFVAPQQTDAPETAKTLTKLAKTYAPRPLVYRLPDHRQSLLGWHGMHRYIHEPDFMKQQLDAIHKAQIKPIKHLALPVIRTIKELDESKTALRKHSIERTPTMKLWFTVATPANVMQLEEVIKHGIDGIVIDTDMLTMLTLGIDKEVSEVARYFDPTNSSVMFMLEQTIKTANRNRLPSIIYGEGPSHHSSMIDKLVSWGITSIAVTPDMIHKTRREIKAAELRLLAR